MVKVRTQQRVVAFHLVADRNRTLNLGSFRGLLRNNNDFHGEANSRLKDRKRKLDKENNFVCMYNARVKENWVVLKIRKICITKNIIANRQHRGRITR